MNSYGLRDDIVAFIVSKAKEFELSKVVLFGSRARGDFSEKSDIDLAVSGDFFDKYIAVLEEDCPTLLAFDFIDLSKSISAELRERIASEGIVLYEVCQL